MKIKLFENFLAVIKRIKAACARARRDPNEVTLMAVSKGAPYEAVEILKDLGILDFGESRIQEASEKIVQAPQGMRWHLIGPLQSNKAVKAIELGFAIIHSVDRVELAARLDNLLEAKDRVQEILLEVNIAKELQKYGFLPEDLAGSLEKISQFGHLKIKGLMCMGPQENNQEQMRPYFREAKRLSADFENFLGRSPIMSMGMSQDFEVAIEEGATMVRLGSALFAPYNVSRPRRQE